MKRAENIYASGDMDSSCSQKVCFGQSTWYYTLTVIMQVDFVLYVTQQKAFSLINSILKVDMMEICHTYNISILATIVLNTKGFS